MPAPEMPKLRERFPVAGGGGRQPAVGAGGLAAARAAAAFHRGVWLRYARRDDANHM